MKILVVIFSSLLSYILPVAKAKIHPAPIVLKGAKLGPILNYPLSMYRIFRTDANGNPEAIPFQIDETDAYGDYILPHGKLNNIKSSNRVFDRFDELSFMGNDVGSTVAPTRWDGAAPSLLYELRFRLKDRIPHDFSREGSVFIGVYFRNPPPLATKKYVHYSPQRAEITTSQYRYRFDGKNYLVTEGIDMMHKKTEGTQPLNLINSSMFYLFADLKYFLSLEVNHRDLNSNLEAYKIGPIRTIVRFNFFYSVLRLKFELGLYTELSFFSNAVLLPAILYNPVDGKKSLNRGSGFYYGFALEQNPKNLNISTNMDEYSGTSIFDIFKSKSSTSSSMYWLTATTESHMIYLRLLPSQKLVQAGSVPKLYVEQTPATGLKDRPADAANPLGKSPVNIALYFDLTTFTEGEHNLAIQLFFANAFNEKTLESFKHLNEWNHRIRFLNLPRAR